MIEIEKTQEVLELAYETVSHSAAYDKTVTKNYIKMAKDSIEKLKENPEFKYNLYLKTLSALELAWHQIDTPIFRTLIYQVAHEILTLRTFITSIHKNINFQKLSNREQNES